LLEEGWSTSANWRIFGARMALTLLIRWDGGKPSEPLNVDEHFGTPAGAIESGRQSVELLRRALRLVDNARSRAQLGAARASVAGGGATSPTDEETLIQYEMRLGEDRRLLTYGLDVMALQVGLVAYHDALYRDDTTAAEAAWTEVESASESLSSYWVPIEFERRGVGLVSRDGLSRSRLRELVRRCRGHRALLDQ